MPRKRKLVAIMFTDIEGYTSLMQKDEKYAIEMRDQHRSIFQPTTTSFEGNIIQYYGDGTLSIFESAVQAVNCAVELQKQFVKFSIPVRIGIHLGDIVVTEEDIIGDGVNLASRVESLASAGTVLISEKVYSEIKNQQNISTKFLGEFNFKNDDSVRKIFAIEHPNIRVPEGQELTGKTVKINKSYRILEKWNEKGYLKFGLIGLLIILLVAMIVLKPTNNPDKIVLANVFDNKKSIAVLYFDNTSNDPDQEYFSDGITEELITHISKIKELRVISKTSVKTYKGQAHNIKNIAQELNVTSILEGSVRKSGDQVRITATLIDAESDENIWTESYTRKLDNIFELQTDIAKSIADNLRVEISPEEHKNINKKFTENSDAYDYFLKGRYIAFNRYYYIYHQKDFDQAKEMYEKAISLDSNFALPYAGLSDLYDAFLQGHNNTYTENYDSLKHQLSRKALKLDPNSAFVNSVRSFSFSNVEIPDYDKAIYYQSRSLEIEPNNASYNWQMGATLSNQLGLLHQGMKFLDKANLLDPLDPNIYFFKVLTYRNLANEIKSFENLEVYRRLSGSEVYSNFYLFHLLYYQKIEEAEKAIKLREEKEIESNFFKCFLYALKGEREKAIKILEENDINAVYIYLTLKMKDEALKMVINKEARRSDRQYLNLQSNPYWNPFREDSAFKNVLENAKKEYELNLQKFGHLAPETFEK